jgi:16S rRNA (uracil1498-N3)-methyltransferase
MVKTVEYSSLGPRFLALGFAAMSERFFVAEPVTDSRVRLDGSEAHHLAHVMRACAGDEVILFDGTNTEFTARVLEIRRSETVLEVLQRRTVDREAANRVILGVALPKSDRQRWLVEKAVEMGVTQLVPLVTSRSIAQPGGLSRKRLQRTVIEACKQCQRNVLMPIAEPTPLADFLAADPRDALRWIAHPAGVAGRTAATEARLLRDPPPEVYLAVGPEGGFTEAEIALAERFHWQVVDLGPRILRVETAALTLVAHCLRG